MLLLISFLLFIGYLYYVSKIHKELPPSISDGYYVLINKSKRLEPLFFIFICGIGLTFLIYGLDKFGELPYSFLIFLAGAGLCFVGTASQFKEDFVKKVHVGAALICGISITLWTAIHGSPFIFVSFLTIFALIFYLDKRRFILWVELLAFANAYAQFYLLHNYFTQ